MLIEKVKKTVARYGLIHKEDTVIVGVSGGPDSVALLFILNSLKKELGLKLVVCHADHGLRPGSAKDARFVESLARKLRLEFVSTRLNVDKKGSLEEAARNARFDFFIKTAAEQKADAVALGHTLDDQAETVLMRLLRGSGLYGLTGITAKRRLRGIVFIRPLIETTRKDVEKLVRAKRIRPRLDPTNRETVFFRNRIRRELLPLLEKKYNQNIKHVLSNTAEHIGQDYDYLRSQAEKFLKKERGKGLPSKKLVKLHPSLRRMVFRSMIGAVKGDTRRLTFAHIQEIDDLLHNRPEGSIVDLPGNVSAAKKKQNIIVYSRRLR